MLVEIFCFLELLHSQGGHPLKRKVTCVAASSWYLFLELSFKPVVFGTRACRRWGVFARALHAYSIGERPAVQRGSGVVGRRLDLADGLWSVEWGLSFGGDLRCVGWGRDLRGSLGGIRYWRDCLVRWHPGELEDGDVWLPDVGGLRQAVSRWGSSGLPGPRDHDLGVLDRLCQAAGAAEVQDGDQDVLLDEPQRLEGQYMLDVLCRDNNSQPLGTCSQFPEGAMGA